MEKALKIQNGKEELVSAEDIQREFHGLEPWGVSFICPLCRQPLFPAAMSLKGIQSPHFRHERNNERAHECELHAKNQGYSSPYQRAPMPMFIRMSRSHRDQFIVEGGFRKLDPTLFLGLEREGARVLIGRKSYNVTSQRFHSGLTKLPFEEVSLKCGSTVRLVNSSYDLNSTWGSPEDAKRAMVFTRDVDTAQGKRLKIGDTIPFETDLYLLLCDREPNSVRSAFTNIHKAGTAGGRSALNRLAVYEVKLTKDDDKWRRSKAYLEECGFEVTDTDSTPKIIWPPSLMASGDLTPLCKSAKCIFETNAVAPDDDKLYIHTSADTADRVRTVPLRRAENEACKFAIFANDARLSFVTTHDWVFSSAVLLHSSDLKIDEYLHENDAEPRLTFNEGRWELEACAPGEVECYERNGAISIHKLSNDSNSICFADGTFDRVRVKQKLFSSFDRIVVFEARFERMQAEKTATAGGNAKAALIRLDAPCDLAFAISRDAGNREPLRGSDRKRALIRKAGGTQA